MLGQLIKQEPSLSLRADRQESLDLFEEVLGDSVNDYKVEEFSTTLSRQSTSVVSDLGVVGRNNASVTDSASEHNPTSSCVELNEPSQACDLNYEGPGDTRDTASVSSVKIPRKSSCLEIAEDDVLEIKTTIKIKRKRTSERDITEEATCKRHLENDGESEPSISSSNRACKRTISSSSSSSASSAGFDSFCVSLAVGPLWWSDVPTIRTNHDRASPLKEFNRKTSIDSTTTASSEYTDLDCTESTVDFMNQHEAAVIQEVLTQPTPTQITLKLYVTAQKHSTWETIFNPLDNMLYVNLPSAMSHEASKHSFISLLEFAEEKLECDGVVLCIRKDRLDRPNLVRTFSFVGFQLVSPKSPLTPPHIEEQQMNEYLFMVYNIEE
ncbi:LOW QUALITY PROTEIN: ornithine decarboxylase antizyme [Malaya genurostris]|uniref:LOW QUALITY PROTEIN: ornithine decarboxylase antizyme n=1 Tax=Malaya genurostris TaxID=325434 RepID=UPI0026F3C8CF|nr:LOW QUALITY PROTEIN: ornithine decarboxylase antizyme [Malaya genurostris]